MPRETAAISAHILHTPFNHAPVDSVVRVTYVRLRLGYNRCKHCAKGKNDHRAMYLEPQEATVVYYWLHAVMKKRNREVVEKAEGVVYRYILTGCRCYAYILTS